MCVGARLDAARHERARVVAAPRRRVAAAHHQVHAEVAEHVGEVGRPEPPLPAGVGPRRAVGEVGGAVEDEELVRDDGVEAAVERAVVVHVLAHVQRIGAASSIGLWAEKVPAFEVEPATLSVCVTERAPAVGNDELVRVSDEAIGDDLESVNDLFNFKANVKDQEAANKESRIRNIAWMSAHTYYYCLALLVCLAVP